MYTRPGRPRVAQLLLLGLAAWVVLRDRISRPARIAGLAAVGALVLGTAFVSTTRTEEIPVANLPPAFGRAAGADAHQYSR